ncbi:MAG: 2-oxoacid:ferredoxin oxidoreductase subunit beta, partial [candidate division KSB1 bacterium]|nr:2-oxoacid:ferredoxin oxidoreductase subunit beta [candidate division KSB1 bacterium]
FNISGLAQAAGASFVARGTVYEALRLDKLIEQAIRKKGFSVVEVMTPCPTAYGRRNRLGNGVDMIRWLKENSVSIQKAANMNEDELEDKIVTGVLVDIEKPEYVEEYEKLIKQVKRQ